MNSPENGIEDKNSLELPAPEHRGADVARAGITAALVEAYSWVDAVGMIALGKALEQHWGMDSNIAATVTFGATAVQTLGLSYAATAGFGDFSYTPKHKAAKWLAENAPPVISLWNGAPTGAIIDKGLGREVTFRRRLVHTLPYSAAVGYLWVGANPVGETVTGTVERLPHTIAHHPEPSAFVAGALCLGAAAAAFKKRRQRR